MQTTGLQTETYGVERIEVMRGPSSVLYGQGQPAGIVNLVTKRPTEQTIREVQLQGGSFDYKQGAFDFSGPANEDKTLLYRLTGLVRDSWRFSVNASNLFDKYYVAACFSMAQCNLGRARIILGTATYRW